MNEILTSDYKLILDCRDLFTSIKTHLFLSDKGGASLQTGTLEELAEVIGGVLSTCSDVEDVELLGAHRARTSTERSSTRA